MQFTLKLFRWKILYTYIHRNWESKTDRAMGWLVITKNSCPPRTCDCHPIWKFGERERGRGLPVRHYHFPQRAYNIIKKIRKVKKQRSLKTLYWIWWFSLECDIWDWKSWVWISIPTLICCVTLSKLFDSSNIQFLDLL